MKIFDLKKYAFIDDPKDEYFKKTPTYQNKIPRKSNQSKPEPKLDEFNELNPVVMTEYHCDW